MNVRQLHNARWEVLRPYQLDILSSIKYGRTIIYKHRHDLEYMEDADKIMEMPK